MVRDANSAGMRGIVCKTYPRMTVPGPPREKTDPDGDKPFQDVARGISHTRESDHEAL